MTTLTAEIDGDLVDKLDNLARKLNKPREWLVSDALEHYVGERSGELKRWRDTEVALEQVARGEVVSAEEVFAWLDSWGEGDEGADRETALHPGG